ncbi:MAG: hypothetical protein ACRD33_05880 [Candidatus Acidiferrales bacterium]
MRWNRSRALQGPLLSVSMLAIAALLGARPALGAPQAAAAGSGAQAELPPVETLHLQDTTVFAAAAPNAYRSGTQCDSEGDAFVQVASLAGVPLRLAPSSSVSEVIPGHKRIVEYGKSPLSESDYPHARVSSFGVLPNGELYALIFTRRDPSKEKPRPEPEYYVERFKDDGTRDSITPIHAPPGVAHWLADLLAPFPDGNFLIAGISTTTKEQPGASSWEPFTAVYDQTGRFLREVTLPHDIANNFNEGDAGKPTAAARAKAQASPTQASKPRQFFEVAISTGGVVSGPDENAWILRASDPVRLYAVNSAGQVVEHFQFSPPAPGLTPFEFGFAGPGLIFVDFSRPPGSPTGPTAASGPSELVGVFNTVSQRFDALYTLPEEVDKSFSNLACSDGNGGFLYFGSTHDRHLAVFDYASR